MQSERIMVYIAAMDLTPKSIELRRLTYSDQCSNGRTTVPLLFFRGSGYLNSKKCVLDFLTIRVKNETVLAAHLQSDQLTTADHR